MRIPSQEITSRCEGMDRPTFVDVLRAHRVIAPHVRRTPLHRYPVLDEMLGFSLYIKHENHQPTGSFKIRGGMNFFLSISEEERKRGVVTGSSGNHGQSMAYGAMLTGGKVKVVVSEGASSVKVASMRAMGAEVVPHRDPAGIVHRIRELADKEGLRYVDGNERLLVAGIATEALEILEDQPDIDVILMPVGSGMGATGACLVAKTINPAIRVIGVQAAGAPAFCRSWRDNRWVEDANLNTFADGLAINHPFALTLSMLIEMLDDMVLLNEEELRRAVILALAETRNLVEGAGAAGLGAAYKMRAELAGQKVATVFTGGNISMDLLRAILEG